MRIIFWQEDTFWIARMRALFSQAVLHSWLTMWRESIPGCVVSDHEPTNFSHALTCCGLAVPLRGDGQICPLYNCIDPTMTR